MRMVSSTMPRTMPDPLAVGRGAHAVAGLPQSGAVARGLAAERRHLAVELARQIVEPLAGPQQGALLGDPDEEALVERTAVSLGDPLAARRRGVGRLREPRAVAALVDGPDAVVRRQRGDLHRADRLRHPGRPCASLE